MGLFLVSPFGARLTGTRRRRARPQLGFRAPSRAGTATIGRNLAVDLLQIQPRRIADTIYDCGSRQAGPLIDPNCAAFSCRKHWRPLQRELAGDEEQCRRQREAQNRIGHANRHMAADDDARERAGEE
jgi:hypothetical protein